MAPTEKNESIELKDDGFKVYTKTLKRQHDVYLGDHILDSTESYNDLLNLFKSEVDREDVVNLYLSNMGGSVSVGLRVCQAMKQCNGVIVVHAEADCYSMGSIIALCGDALILYPGAFLMFHNYSIWHGGKGGESHLASEEHRRQFKDIMEHCCYPFLSRGEINKLAEDKDFYVHPQDADLKKRLKRHFKRMQV